MTSTWSQSAPSTAFASSARRAKSADRMLGLICTAMRPSLPCPRGLAPVAGPGPDRSGPGSARPWHRALSRHASRPTDAASLAATRREGAMTGKRGIAHLVCGRRAKWLVLVLWLVVLFLARAARAEAHRRPGQRRGVLAARRSAESTQVLQLSEDFRPEQIPAVVVYARESGLTPAGPGADRRGRGAAQAADATTASAARETPGPGLRPAGRPAGGPDPRADHHGREGLGADRTRRRLASGTSSATGGGGLAVHITGPGRHVGGLLRGLRGHRLDAAALGDGRGHRHAADHLPQPHPAPGPAARRWSPRCSPRRR